MLLPVFGIVTQSVIKSLGFVHYQVSLVVIQYVYLCTAPQPPDPPGMVGSNIVDSTTVTLQWTEPPLTTILNVTDYYITYRHPARNDMNESIVLPGDQLNVTIAGLDGGQLYLFNVSAVNMNGAGLPLIYTISTPIGMS